MTDTYPFPPDAVAARVEFRPAAVAGATPGGTFVTGPGWGEWTDSLVVCTQQGKKLVLLKLTDDGTRVAAQSSALENAHGRLRSATAVGDGSLLITTDNGSGDQVLQVRPA